MAESHVLYRGYSLASVDAKRFFFSTLWGIRRVFKYDLANSQYMLNLTSGASVVFSWTGFSFRISKKILDYVDNLLAEIDERISPYLNQMSTAVYNFLTGNWHIELDETAIDYDIKIGATLDAAHHLIFSGFMYLELGKFDATKNIIEWLKKISDDFNDEGVKVIYYHLNALFLKKLRKLDESIKVGDECINISEKIGQRDRTISLLGIQSQSHLMKNDLSLAKESLDKSIPLISNEDIVFPYYYSSYLMGAFLYDIAKLEESKNKDRIDLINEYKLKAKESGDKVIKNSKKVVSERTRTYLQMGKYYWLIGKHRKALKRWERSIQEGERLGARPDLSRTYFEVGKRLLEPNSKYRDLNGIDAKGYLEKARELFVDMGLERDLNELDSFTSQI